EWAQTLIQGEFDRAFIVLHGRGGEDGVMQGLLQSLNLPYTGSGVLGSAIAMDKMRSKCLWQAHQLNTPKFQVIEEGCDWAALVAALGLPVAVKPATEGSSVGISKVSQEDDLPAAYAKARAYDTAVIAEQWITGRELTCTVLHDECLPLVEIETESEFYDYQAKYESDATQYHCPVSLPSVLTNQLQAMSRRAFDCLGASGWGRVDLILDESEQPFLIEVNTVPGMTSHSLVPMAAHAAGYSFDELVIKILETSLKSKGAPGRRQP
ncbi:MAG TPA: D-alanine--D-alanine ligase, partial [Gammaproteobacteria bacterium]|nr:D-alanine--D-alanine ligase [Gammaproteobacteria bacterium]